MDFERGADKGKDLSHGKVTKSITEVLPSVRSLSSPVRGYGAETKVTSRPFTCRDPSKTPSPPKVSIPSILHLTQSQVQEKPRVNFRAPFSVTRSNTVLAVPLPKRTPSSGYFSRNFRPPGVQPEPFKDTDDISTKLKLLEDQGLLQKIKNLQFTKTLDVDEDEDEEEDKPQNKDQKGVEGEVKQRSTTGSWGTISGSASSPDEDAELKYDVEQGQGKRRPLGPASGLMKKLPEQRATSTVFEDDEESEREGKRRSTVSDGALSPDEDEVDEVFKNDLEQIREKRKPLGPVSLKATSNSSPNICHPTISKTIDVSPDISEAENPRRLKKIQPLNAKIRASKSDPDISTSIKMSPKKSSSRSEAKSSSSIASLDMDSKDSKKIRIKGRQYLLLGLIGKGGSAKVYHIFNQLTEQSLALKVVDLRDADESTRAGYTNEINLLERLSKCKRVVRLVDYENRMDKSSGEIKTLLLIMEKGDTDLANLLKGFLETDSKYSLDPHLVKHYWREMLVAVNEIHSMDVVHSDLKPVNFITVAGKLKLIDFGIANAIQSDHTSVIKDSQVGTINYMAPEALSSRPDLDPSGGKSGKAFIKFNSKADIWSLGCILYNLLYGKPPFAHCSTLIQKIQAICNPRSIITFGSHADRHAVDCVKKCLERDPRRRPSAEDLLKHPYLTSNQSTDIDSNLPQNPQVKNMFSQINDFTPNRMKKLNSFLQSLAATKQGK